MIRVKQAPGSAGYVLLLALSVLSLAAFWINFLTLPESAKNTLYADDAFYVIKSAQNFVSGNGWTFDGDSPHSGFQVLHGYFVAIVGAATGWSIDVTPLALALCGILLTILALKKIAESTIRPAQLGALAVLVSAPIFAWNSVGLMEWSLVLFFGSSMLMHYTRPTVWVWAMLACLSRSDFGIFATALAVTHLLLREGGASSNRRILFGVLLAAVITLAHSYLITGNPIPTSIRVKSTWGESVGPSTEWPLYWLGATIGKMGDGWWWVLCGAFVVVAYLTAKRSVLTHFRVAGYFSTLIALTSYIGIYLYVNDSYHWYHIGFFFVVMSALFLATGYPDESQRSVWLQRAFLWISAVIVGVNIYSTQTMNGPWLGDATIYMASRDIATDTSIHNLAAWGAGKPAWYSEKKTYCLDGLVSEEAVSTMKASGLVGYVSAKHMDWIMAYPELFTRFGRQRWPENEKLVQHLVGLRRAWTTGQGPWQTVGLWEVDHAR